MTQMNETVEALSQRIGAFAPLRDYVVDSPAAAQIAVDTGKALRVMRKEIVEERDKALRPLREAMDKIRGWFSGPLEGCDEVISALKHKIQAYQTKVAEETRKALTEARSREEITRAVEAVVPAPKGQHTRKYYSARVVDESKVPREYMVVDVKRLNALASAEKERFNIPGCEIEVKEQVVLR